MIIILITAIHCTLAGTTNVAGVISADAVWTIDGSPYLISDNALIQSKGSLVIEPGVEVLFEDGKYIYVDGTLVAVGAPDSIILFSSASDNPQPGDWRYMHFSDSSTNDCYVEYCEIRYAEHGIDCYSASPTIRNNIIRNNSSRGIEIDQESSSIIENNIVSDNGDYGIICMGCSPTIIGNTVSNNGYNGINCSGSGEPLVKNNTVTENTIGIDCSDTDPSIRMNSISENSEGILLSNSNAEVKNNALFDNEIGIRIRAVSDPTIQNNVIVRNSSYSLKLQDISNDISAQKNYWGTDDSAAIAVMIYDFYDDFFLGKVQFMPCLDTTNIKAPLTGTVSKSRGINKLNTRKEILTNGNIMIYDLQGRQFTICNGEKICRWKQRSHKAFGVKIIVSDNNNAEVFFPNIHCR